MQGLSIRSAVLGSLLLVTMMVMGGSFVVAAVQGEFGVMRRVELNAEAAALRMERDVLQAELKRIENLNLRLSDSYLDIDLLDERARIVLGYLRADEVVIR
jgi:cell division protein FtsB